jgi:acyl-ACP thioesterase
MKQAIWTEPYRVNTLLLDHTRCLGLNGLVRALQDVAWIHAAHLGHGYEDLIKHDTLWVLTRQKLRMRAWPAWGDDMVLRTWVRPITGPVAYRDCEVLVDGVVVGEATSVWLTLDRHTRRPVRLSLGEDKPHTRAEGVLDLEPERIPVRDGLAEAGRVPVRIGDLDLNGHVNNAVYAQWCLDSLPLDEQAAHRLTGYEVSFLAESRLGDAVVIERAERAPHEGGEMPGLHVQGRRAADGKPVFTARLLSVPV